VAVDVEEDRDAEVGQGHAGQRQQDRGDRSHLDAAELDRRTDAEAVHGSGEDGDELLGAAEYFARTEDDQAGERERHGADDEHPDQRGARALAAAHVAAPSPAPGPSRLPARVRKRRTFALSECSSRSRGLPRAVMVRSSMSRNTQSSPIDRMLASSWETMT